MNLEHHLSKISLSTEQLEDLKKYGALGYKIDKICILLGIRNKHDFIEEFENETSEIYLNYWQGYYEAEFLVDDAILDDAKAAKTEAVKRYDKQREHARIMDIIKNIDGEKY